MKTFLCITTLFLAAAFSRADVTIEQKIESAMMNGNMTMKIKGDNARMDMPSPVGGNVTVIMNMKSGDMTTLMHAQKMAMKMNMNDTKKQAEAAAKAAGLDPSKIEKPKATGIRLYGNVTVCHRGSSTVYTSETFLKLMAGRLWGFPAKRGSITRPSIP